MKHDDVEVPRLNKVEATVLELVQRAGSRELYGLEILRASDGVLTRGSLYTTLDRMEAKGYIESHHEKVAASDHVPKEHWIPRRLFRITGHGHAALCGYEAGRDAYRKARASLQGA
jgi:PadR family transcriptional regulator, regulatory protein PadR